MPGRCAAPPAPATMTSRPRPAADEAYSAIHAGVRCADTMRHSWAIPNSDRISSAFDIVSQSDWLPMMTPTSGPASGTRLFQHEGHEGHKAERRISRHERRTRRQDESGVVHRGRGVKSPDEARLC